MTKRLVLITILATSLLAADTITSGLILAQAGGSNPPTFYGLAGSTFDFRLSSSAAGGPSPAPVTVIGDCGADGCIGFSPVFGFDFSTTLNSTLSSLEYNGITYDLTQPFSFSLDLTAAAQGYNSLPPGEVLGTFYSFGSAQTFSPVSFTLTGDATFIWNGQTIFSNLALSGSGSATASTSTISGPLGGSTVSNMVYEVGTTADTPEPTAASLALTGIAAIALAVRKRRT